MVTSRRAVVTVQQRCWNAPTSIGDAEAHVIAARGRAERDAPTPRRELDAVRDQICDGLLQQLRIAENAREISFDASFKLNSRFLD